MERGLESPLSWCTCMQDTESWSICKYAMGWVVYLQSLLNAFNPRGTFSVKRCEGRVAGSMALPLLFLRPCPPPGPYSSCGCRHGGSVSAT